MTGLASNNGNRSAAYQTRSGGSSGPQHIGRPAPSVSLVIPVRNDARNIARILEQIADDVDEVILIDRDSIDGALITALSDRPDIKPVPLQTGDSHMGSSTRASAGNTLHAEPIG